MKAISLNQTGFTQIGFRPEIRHSHGPDSPHYSQLSRTGEVNGVGAIRGSSPIDKPDENEIANEPTERSFITDEGDSIEISEESRKKATDSASEISQKLNITEQVEIAKLRAMDREVRAHEQAHLAAAGAYARGGAHYTYRRGPDGRLYAAGGEVGIDTSPVPDDPDATIRKAQTVRQAALAPAKPSSQDRAVAAQATKMEATARAEKLKEEKEEPESIMSIDHRESGNPNEGKEYISMGSDKNTVAQVGSRVALWA